MFLLFAPEFVNALDVLHETDDEVTRSDERIDNVYPCIRERTTELGFQDVRHTVHHEIDDRLRCVDDAVCVRNVLGEPLEELLVERVEEVLFLGEVSAERRRLFDSDVESVQRSKKFVTAHRLPHQDVADVFYLACDDVSTREVRPIEDCAKAELWHGGIIAGFGR